MKGGFSHQVYRKKTHIDLYLHSKSHHNFAQKISVINTLDTRAFNLSYEEHIDDELKHLKEVFKMNRYNDIKFNKMIMKVRKGPQTKIYNDKEATDRINLPYIKGTIEKIAKILKRGNIRVSFSPPNTLRKLLDHVKDPIDPKLLKGV